MSDKLKILFIWSAAEFSTFDVARGYRNALEAQGHEVFDFRTYGRIKFFGMAIRNDPAFKDDNSNVALITRLAAEGAVVEALRNQVDLVVAICGMGFHPDGLELLRRGGFPVAVLLTEAPYDDAYHVKYAVHSAHPFVNDRWSARQHGWGYLAAAYDPALHKPGPTKEKPCDVLVVGTGWPERQRLLEGVDWSGINLQIRGWWEGITKGTPLWRYYKHGPIDNDKTVALYRGAKVCINQHRFHPSAESLNPRAYELAGCGAYQISDYRPELDDVFGGTVPVYRTPAELEHLIRAALGAPKVRYALALEQRAKLRAGAHTFRDRAAELMAAITSGGIDGQASRTERPVLLAGIRGERDSILQRG